MKGNWKVLTAVGLLLALMGVSPLGSVSADGPVVQCPPTPTPTPPPPPTGDPLDGVQWWLAKDLTLTTGPLAQAVEYYATDVPRAFGRSGIIVSAITVEDAFTVSATAVHVRIVGQVDSIYLANATTGELYLLAFRPSPNLDAWFRTGYAGPLPSSVPADGIWSLAVFYDVSAAGYLDGWTLRLAGAEPTALLIGE